MKNLIASLVFFIRSASAWRRVGALIAGLFFGALVFGAVFEVGYTLLQPENWTQQSGRSIINVFSTVGGIGGVCFVSAMFLILMSIALGKGQIGSSSPMPVEHKSPDFVDTVKGVVTSAFDLLFPIFGLGQLVTWLDAEIPTSVLTREEVTKLLCHQDRQIAARAAETCHWQGWIRDGSLRGLYVPKANLPYADLTGAIMTRSCFHKANLCNANLSGGSFPETDFSSAQMSWARLEGTDLRYSNLFNANLEKSDLKAAILVGALLVKTNFQNCNLQNVNFAAAIMSDTILDGAKLVGANLQGAEFLEDAQFERAARLRNATMPNNARYDGRYGLSGDLEKAASKGLNIGDEEAMANFYGVSIEAYIKGQVWRHKHRKHSHPKPESPVR